MIRWATSIGAQQPPSPLPEQTSSRHKEQFPVANRIQRVRQLAYIHTQCASQFPTCLVAPGFEHPPVASPSKVVKVRHIQTTTVDGRNPAPPKKPCDNSPANITEQLFQPGFQSGGNGFRPQHCPTLQKLPFSQAEMAAFTVMMLQSRRDCKKQMACR